MRRPLRRIPPRRLRAAIAETLLPTSEAPRPRSEPGAVAFFRAPGRLAPRRRIYAVGDVHGSAEKLRALHRAIAADLAARPVPAALVIHLGDYLNGGPDSAAVLARLRGDPIGAARTINLIGDHEQMLLEAIAGDRAAATDWLHAGGAAALLSWGLDPATPREQWAERLPRDDIAFLQSLVLSHREGDYLFVHAGIRPSVALTEQTRDDLLRIRQPFLDTEQDLGVVVVHGHSATGLPTIRPNRIGIDTGAGLGGTLTCAVLEEDRVGFLSA